VADPQATAAIVADAIVSAGCRAVIGAGWAGLRPLRLTADIYVADELPHD
jgi:hypothetical protein